MYVHHLTITTGHSKRSMRADVSDAALAVIAPWLDNVTDSHAIEPIPGEPSYGAQALTEAGALLLTVWGPIPDVGKRLPIITLGVAQRSRQSAVLWSVLIQTGKAAPGVRQPDAPWCAVHLHPTAAGYPDALQWLGDFERVVAWAWITRRPALELTRLG